MEQKKSSIKDNIVVKIISTGIGGVIGIGAGKIAKKALETVIDSTLGSNIFVKLASVVITGIATTYVGNYVQNNIETVVEVIDVQIKDLKTMMDAIKKAEKNANDVVIDTEVIVNTEIVLQN